MRAPKLQDFNCEHDALQSSDPLPLCTMLSSNLCDVYSQFAWRMRPRNLIPEQALARACGKSCHCTRESDPVARLKFPLITAIFSLAARPRVLNSRLFHLFKLSHMSPWVQHLVDLDMYNRRDECHDRLDAATPAWRALRLTVHCRSSP